MKLSISAAALACLTAIPAQAQQWESIETLGGAWDTNWGDVWVMPTASGYEGTYTDDNGRFWLEFTGHVFEGAWAEDHSNERCDYPVMGSYYWGRLEFSNSDQFPGFRMMWGYCDWGYIDKVWSFRERLPDGL